jgi:hypothetical protein
MIASIEAITYIAGTTRDTLVELWPPWKRACGHPDSGCVSEDTCIPTSFTLCELLSRCADGWHWFVVGGRPTARTPSGGLWYPDGRGGGHLWVEGRRRPQKIITVDITADQFGGPEVVVMEGGSPYHVANATRKLINQYRVNEHLTVRLWIAAVVYALQAQAN